MSSKCEFNGIEKTITVLPEFGTISVKDDLYSAWKEWIVEENNFQYLPAIRVIGGDPIGGGKFAGDIYFLMNGWTVVIDHEVTVEGTLYHDDGIEPFVLEPGGSVRSVVSSLVQSVSSDGYTLSDVTDAVNVELQPLMAEIQKTLKKVEEAQAFILSS
jgi:hypothetical protein